MFGLQDIIDIGLDVFHTGSRAVCNPAPMDTDDDYLVTVPNIASQKLLAKLLEADGWTCSSKEYKLSAGSQSWRRGEVNLIVTSDQSLSRRWKIATMICARLNALNKQDRIDVFNAVVFSVGSLVPKVMPGLDDF